MPAAAATAEAPQHMTALKRANEIRLARAELKHQVNAGTTTIADVIANVPDCAASMAIAELVCSQRRWGTTRCSKLLASIGMPETKTIGSMTLRQRAALIDRLGFAGSDAHKRVAILEHADRRHRGGPCSRLNGSGPCLRHEGHDGSCVRAVHAPALGIVHFRNGITDEWIASAEIPLGADLPPAAKLAGLFELALRERAAAPTIPA